MMSHRLPLLVLLLLASATPTLARAQRGSRGAVDSGAQARSASDAGVPADAGGPARAADAAAVERARTLFVEAQAAYAAGRFDEASQGMVQAWQLTHAAELAFNAARVFERMSDYERAIEYFQIYLRDGQPTPEERTAIDARITGIREAEARRRQQVFTAPASEDELTSEARTFFLRGVSMFRRGQYQAAQTAFLAAYRFAPLPEVVYNLAVTSERLGARQDAIDYYREYVRARPDGPDRGAVEALIRRLRSEAAR